MHSVNAFFLIPTETLGNLNAILDVFFNREDNHCFIFFSKRGKICRVFFLIPPNVPRDTMSFVPSTFWLSASFLRTLAKDISRDISWDIFGNISRDISGDIFGNISRDISWDIFGNISSDISRDIFGNISRDISVA